MDCSKKGLIKIHNKSREQKATSELSRPSRRSPPSAWRRTGGWLLPVLAAAIIFAPPFAPTVEAQTTLVSNVEVTPLLWTVYGFRIKPHLSASIHS